MSTTTPAPPRAASPAAVVGDAVRAAVASRWPDPDKVLDAIAAAVGEAHARAVELQGEALPKGAHLRPLRDDGTSERGLDVVRIRTRRTDSGDRVEVLTVRGAWLRLDDDRELKIGGAR